MIYSQRIDRWRSLRGLILRYSHAAHHEPRAIDRAYARTALDQCRVLYQELIRAGVLVPRVTIDQPSAA